MSDSPDVSVTTESDIDGYFTTARTSGRTEAVELPQDSYTSYLYDLDDPKIAESRGMTYEEFTADRQQNPFLQELLAFWDGLYAEPFVGITTDGTVVPDLYPLPEQRDDDADLAPRRAAQKLLELLSPVERERICYPADAPDWRGWSNPEFVFHRNGLRLEELTEQQAQAVLELVQVSLSPQGFERVAEAMALNGYLGELVDLPTIMNDRSFWVSIFGSPVEGEPWGWQLFGHHVVLNVVWIGGRQVIAPAFIGGEPALSAGRPPLFATREATALELAGSLSDQQRERTIVYASVLDPAMPEGRLHPADERHLAGAFRDNRVIPYEGLPAAELTEEQQSLLRTIVEDFHLLLPQQQRDATLADYDAHLDQTWFAWYGATDGTQPFYFRIQSPVIIAELDHHAGVWLSNRLPARFHVHTTLRLPNGNDYGRAYLDQWRSQRNEDR